MRFVVSRPRRCGSTNLGGKNHKGELLNQHISKLSGLRHSLAVAALWSCAITGVAQDASPTSATRTEISASTAEGLLLSKTAPVYPPLAELAHVSGTVLLRASISRTGTIEDLHVVDGVPLLQQAAMDAVKTWRYRPYLVNGAPVEVDTTVSVIFTLDPDDLTHAGGSQPTRSPVAGSNGAPNATSASTDAGDTSNVQLLIKVLMSIDKIVFLPVVDERPVQTLQVRVNLEKLRQDAEKMLAKKNYVAEEAENVPPDCRWFIVLRLKGLGVDGATPSAVISGSLCDGSSPVTSPACLGRGKEVWTGSDEGRFQFPPAPAQYGLAGASSASVGNLFYIATGLVWSEATRDALERVTSFFPYRPRKRNLMPLKSYPADGSPDHDDD